MTVSFKTRQMILNAQLFYVYQYYVSRVYSEGLMINNNFIDDNLIIYCINHAPQLLRKVFK